MESEFLRRIVQTFCNDEQGDFGKWAKNPRVIEILKKSKTDGGRRLRDRSRDGTSHDLVFKRSCKRRTRAIRQESQPKNQCRDERFSIRFKRTVQDLTRRKFTLLQKEIRRDERKIRASVGYYESHEICGRRQRPIRTR